VRVVVLMIVAACASEPQAELPKQHFVRPLVTDKMPLLSDREQVRGYFGANDWCERRTWPQSEEFAICDPHPYLNRSTPPMFAIVRYDQNRATAFAVFTPVPCRMYGRCDALLEATNVAEYDFVDHEHGLRHGLVPIGQMAEHHDDPLPSMQQRMVDGLAQELDRRFGPRVWRDPHDYGSAWSTPTEDIGLFVVGHGRWVVETHELHATGSPGFR
jgi:hypothetical protein